MSSLPLLPIRATLGAQRDPTCQPTPTRRRDPLLIRGWRAQFTRAMCCVLFVYFIGGPAAIVRACSDDTTCDPNVECCDESFGYDSTMSEPSSAPSDPASVSDTSSPPPSSALNDTVTTDSTSSGGTEPVVASTSEPPPPDAPPADTTSTIDSPPAAPDPVPDTPPVEPVSETSLPDPMTETPPDSTPTDTSVADTPPPDTSSTDPAPTDTSSTDTTATDATAPVSDPVVDTSASPPVDDSSWSTDTTNTDIVRTQLLRIDAPAYAALDDAGAWDGVNKFRVHDGNAHRAIPELTVHGTVSQLGLSWTRYSNTVERPGRRNFGTAGNWRHSWQYDLVPLPPEKGDPRPLLGLVYPDGTQRSFTKTGPATYESVVGFSERATVGNGRIDIETGNGSQLHFVIQRRADGKFRYNLVSLVDPHGEATQLDYDADGFLTKVTEMGSGRSLALGYKQIKFSAADRAMVARIKAPFPAAGQWVELTVDPKFKASVWRYLRLRLHPSATPARVAEIQFFAPGATTPLTGTVIGDLAGAAQAFDGNADTVATGDVSALRFAGLDFGAAGTQVERIRVLVGAGAPFAECAIEGLVTTPSAARVLTEVRSDDGRAMHYDYGTVRHKLDGVQDVALVRTRYGDGTTAAYKYGYALPAGYRPAMVEAKDPRYAGRAKTIRYEFYPLRPEGTLGEIHRERNPATGKVLATRESDIARDPLKRTVTYGDQRQVVYTMTAKGERQLAARTDELGRTDRWEYAPGKIPATAVVRHNGDRVDFQRDARGRLIAQTHTPKNSPARLHTIQRDAQGRVAGQTDRFGRTQRIARDGNGRITRIDHVDGTFETRSYDAHGRLTFQRNRDGTARTLAYNARGLPATVTDATGRTTRYAYNRYDQLVRVTDAAGRSTRYLRSERGQLVQQINSDGTSRTFAYDALGRHTGTTDELGRTTTRELDHLGRTLKETDPAGNVTSYDYAELPNGCGACSMSDKPTNIRLPSGQQIAQLYDAAGRMIARTVAAGSTDSATTTFSYTDDDRLASSTDPKGRVTRHAYDDQGKLTSRTEHNGRTTRFAYDAFDNLATVTAPDGRSRNLAYDTRGRLSRETDAAGNSTRYVYTDAGDLAVLIDARGNRHWFTYDAQRRKTAMTYPDGTREQWSYDATGRLATTATRAGQVKTTTYDGRGRAARIAWSPAGAAPTITLEYDAGNQVKAMDNGVARLTYTYDFLGRTLTETTRLAASVATVAPQTLTYAYGRYFQRIGLTYPDGSIVRYGYNVRHQLATISRNSAAPLASYAYDVDGRVAGVTCENGVSTRYTYDPVGQLLGVSHQKGNTVLASAAYTLDTLARRTAQIREDGLTERYTYDATGQLTGADYGVGPGAGAKPTRSTSYSYDALGNFQRVADTAAGTTDYDANALNQYTWQHKLGGGKPAGFTYDRNGNLTGLTGRGGQADAAYRYNAQNQLIAAETGGMRMEFYYDAQNRCVARKQFDRDGHDLWSFSPSESQVLLYDGWNLVNERRLDGTAVANYVHGARIDEILAMVTPTGTLYPVYDGLGSAAALTDGKGAVTERYRYEVFGALRFLTADYKASAASSAGFRFLFTGREWLGGVGLNDHRNRYYTPQLGRWISTDPIGFHARDASLYRYASNMPTSLVDPTGQDWLDCMARCIQDADPLNAAQETLLTAAGATIPYSAARCIFGAKSGTQLTTVNSVIGHLLGTGTAASGGNLLASVGRFFSPAWVGYGVYMTIVDAGCAAACGYYGG